MEEGNSSSQEPSFVVTLRPYSHNIQGLISYTHLSFTNQAPRFLGCLIYE